MNLSDTHPSERVLFAALKSRPMEPKYTVDHVYTILEIDPHCDWYRERGAFEHKAMRCVEVFTDDDSAGFCFEDPEDAPLQYDPRKAFCFLHPVVKPGKPHQEGQTRQQEAPRH